MKNLHNRYKRYREWKLEPHQVAPLSEEQHECATCGLDSLCHLKSFADFGRNHHFSFYNRLLK